MAIAARPLNCWPIRRSAGAKLRGIWPELSAIDPSIAVHLEIDAKYDVYLKRQTADVDAFRRDEGLILSDIDYSRGARALQRGPVKARSGAAADGGAGGPARWPDPGSARNFGGLSAARSAAEACGGVRVRLFHVKQDVSIHQRRHSEKVRPQARLEGCWPKPRLEDPSKGAKGAHLRLTQLHIGNCSDER